MKYKEIGEWILDCKRLVERDEDNVILFVGEEGRGKSTVMFQVMRALDPSFSAERAHFGVADFLAEVPLLERGQAAAADEIRLNKRDAMTRPVRDFLDFLKDCRALNLHLGLCFPRSGWLDSMVLDRVRWRVEVPAKGVMVLHQRVTRKQRKRGGEEVEVVSWVERGRWRTAPNSGALWDAYLEKKRAHMRSLGAKYREDAARGGRPSGVDLEDAVSFFRDLRSVYDEKAGPGAAVHEGP